MITVSFEGKLKENANYMTMPSIPLSPHYCWGDTLRGRNCPWLKTTALEHVSLFFMEQHEGPMFQGIHSWKHCFSSFLLILYQGNEGPER